MKRWLSAFGCVGFLCSVVLEPAMAAPVQQGAMADAAERMCVVEINSPSNESIRIQNLCRNPIAVRISWGDGRLYDYCLNSSGDVRYVLKRTSSYKLTREQAILLCQ